MSFANTTIPLDEGRTKSTVADLSTFALPRYKNGLQTAELEAGIDKSKDVCAQKVAETDATIKFLDRKMEARNTCIKDLSVLSTGSLTPSKEQDGHEQQLDEVDRERKVCLEAILELEEEKLKVCEDLIEWLETRQESLASLRKRCAEVEAEGKMLDDDKAEELRENFASPEPECFNDDGESLDKNEERKHNDEDSAETRKQDAKALDGSGPAATKEIKGLGASVWASVVASSE